MERPEFQLCFKDYCDGCPNMQIRHDTIYGDGIPLIVTISCEHLQTCQNIEERLREAEHDIR